MAVLRALFPYGADPGYKGFGGAIKEIENGHFGYPGAARG
jgi:hypothetical protein